MINKLISPYEFNTLDFTEAELMSKPKVMNNELEIACRLVTFLGENMFDDVMWKNNVFMGNYDDMYSSGICYFKFTSIIEYIEEWRNRSGFISGFSMKLSDNECKESYASVVFPPIGIYGANDDSKWIEFVVKTLNPIEIRFDERDLVYIQKCCKNPRK